MKQYVDFGHFLDNKFMSSKMATKRNVHMKPNIHHSNQKKIISCCVLIWFWMQNLLLNGVFSWRKRFALVTRPPTNLFHFSQPMQVFKIKTLEFFMSCHSMCFIDSKFLIISHTHPTRTHFSACGLDPYKKVKFTLKRNYSLAILLEKKKREKKIKIKKWPVRKSIADKYTYDNLHLENNICALHSVHLFLCYLFIYLFIYLLSRLQPSYWWQFRILVQTKQKKYR